MPVPWLDSHVAATAGMVAGGMTASRRKALKRKSVRETARRGAAEGAARGWAASLQRHSAVAARCKKILLHRQLAAAKSNKSTAERSEAGRLKRRTNTALRQQVGRRKRRTRAELRQFGRRKRQNSGQLAAATSVKSADLDLFLGSLNETDHQHCVRHRTYGREAVQNCLRCVSIRRREEIARIAPWAAPRPCHLGGAWRFGCVVCANGRLEKEVQERRCVHMRANADTKFSRESISRCSAWGKFQVGEALPWWVFCNRLAAHASTDFHRLSAHVARSSGFRLAPLNAHGDGAKSREELNNRLDAVAAASTVHTFGQLAAPSEPGHPPAPSVPRQPGAPSEPRQPAAPDQTTTTDCGLDLAIGSIQDPFRGTVPQREDWVEVWADSTSAISLRKQETLQEKRGLSQSERRRKRQLLAIEAEAVRENCRKRLREATSASMAFDECDTRKLFE